MNGFFNEFASTAFTDCRSGSTTIVSIEYLSTCLLELLTVDFANHRTPSKRPINSLKVYAKFYPHPTYK